MSAKETQKKQCKNSSHKKINIEAKKAEETAGNACKGVIYRASVFCGKTERGFTHNVNLRKSKKMSCPGCIKCGYVTEIENNRNDPIIGIESCQNGELYMIGIDPDYDQAFKLFPVNEVDDGK